jgi:hypothetical protein
MFYDRVKNLFETPDALFAALSLCIWFVLGDFTLTLTVGCAVERHEGLLH